MAKGVIDSLLVELGYEYSDDDLKQFKSDVSDLNDNIKSLIGLAAKGAAAITALVTATSTAVDEQGKFSKELGINVEWLSSLEFASQKAGDSVDSVRGSLRSFSSTLSQAARGIGGGLEAFGLLGVEVTDIYGNIRDIENVVLDVNKAIQNIPKSQQIELLGQLGLGGSTRLLQLAPNLLREYIAEAESLGLTTAEDTAIAAEFKDTMVSVWAVIKDISRAITKNLSPELKKTSDFFVEWWKVNREMIKLKLPVWINNISIAIRALSVAVAGFLALKLLGLLGSAITLVKSLTLAVVGLNASAFLTPAFLATAIAAIALLIEDAKVFFEGGQSVIGDLIQKFPEWEERILLVAKALVEVKDSLVAILDLTNDIIDKWNSTSDSRDKAISKGLISSLGGVAQVASFLNLGNKYTPDLGNSNGGNPTIQRVEVGGITIEVNSDGSPSEVAEAVYDRMAQAILELNSGIDQ